jgi:hypothetical protein
VHEGRCVALACADGAELALLRLLVPGA